MCREADSLSPTVQYTVLQQEGRVKFCFQDGSYAEVPIEHVQRSDMLCGLFESSTANGETTIPFPSAAECMLFQIWAAVTQSMFSMLDADSAQAAAWVGAMLVRK